MKVVIVGAGIGGLACALALSRMGVDVQVVEQAKVLGEVGAGIQMSANGTRILHWLGLDEGLAQIAAFPNGKEIRLWSTGQTWKLFDLGAQSVEMYGFPYLMVHRADLHALLLQAFLKHKPGGVLVDHQLVDFEQKNNQVQLHFSHQTSIAADLLIGADGVHSVVRKTLFGADQPFFTGCMAWRGLIEAKTLPAHLSKSIGVNWVGPGRHVVHYPVRRGELVNFVGIVEKSDWQIESWNQLGDRQECSHDFDGWHEDIHELIHAIQTPYKWALMGREPLDSWHEGRVVLLGDACHPTLPFLAQGAMMALEDAVVLARCLTGYEHQLDQALMRYEHLRQDRTRKIVIGSNENAKRFHNPMLKDAQGATQYVQTEWAPDKVKMRYDWLFKYDATNLEI